jgi:hypothetical protein
MRRKCESCRLYEYWEGHHCHGGYKMVVEGKGTWSRGTAYPASNKCPRLKTKRDLRIWREERDRGYVMTGLENRRIYPYGREVKMETWIVSYISLFENELKICKVEASDWMDAARKAMPGNAEWFDEMGDISKEDFYNEFFDADSAIKIERLDELTAGIESS